jgi:hypothetical protein
MCPMALDLTSRLKWAPALPRVLYLRTSPPNRGGLRRCHVSYGSGPHIPVEVVSGASMCPAGPYGPRVSSINKSIAGLPMQLDTHVPNTRVHVSKAPHVRAIMRLQDVQASSVVNTCKACGHASTMWLQYGYSATAALWTTRLAPLQCQVTRHHDATLLTEYSVAGDKTRRAHTVEDIICYS